MARVSIEDFDSRQHGNPMAYVDNVQAKRSVRAPTLIPYKVCLVTVCGFTFVFHSIQQLQACLDYYGREHQPTSRLPVYSGNYGGDHGETQRWFERLPQYLLESPKRAKVVSALKQALVEYSQVPGARPN